MKNSGGAFQRSKIWLDKKRSAFCDEPPTPQSPITDRIHFAIEKNDFEKVKFLIEEKKIDVNKRGVLGFTPLYCAVEAKNFEISNYLILKGAKVNAQSDCDKSTPLMMAVKNKHLKLCQLLIKAGAKPEMEDFVGDSSFDMAEESNCKEILDLFFHEENQ